jgi:hypothetical protein
MSEKFTRIFVLSGSRHLPALVVDDSYDHQPNADNTAAQAVIHGWILDGLPSYDGQLVQPDGSTELEYSVEVHRPEDANLVPTPSSPPFIVDENHVQVPPVEPAPVVDTPPVVVDAPPVVVDTPPVVPPVVVDTPPVVPPVVVDVVPPVEPTPAADVFTVDATVAEQPLVDPPTATP